MVQHILKHLGCKPTDHVFLVLHLLEDGSLQINTSGKQWKQVRDCVSPMNVRDSRFYLVSGIEGLYSLNSHGACPTDVPLEEQYRLVCAMGIDVPKQTPRPDWALSNPFARCSMGSWVAAHDTVGRMDEVKRFSRQQVRWALALPDCQKTVTRACLTRLRSLYYKDGRLIKEDEYYPQMPDTLAFVRRIAVLHKEEMPLHINRLHRYICEQAGCGLDGREGKMHRFQMSSLSHAGYLNEDSGSGYVTFTEVTRAEQEALCQS